MKTRVVFLIIFFLSLSGRTFASDSPDKGGTENRIKDEWVNLDVDPAIEFLDTALVSGLNIAAKYGYEIRPSYQDGLFTRVDRYAFTRDISPGEIISDDLPVYLRFIKESELIFVRQFESHKKAKFSKPVNPKHIPLTAQKAIDDLDVGTFVSIPTKINLLTGSEAIGRTNGLKVRYNAHLLISGEFQIQILRLRDKKVRVRLVAVKRKLKGVNGKIELDLNVFKVSIINSAVEAILGADLLDFGVSKDKGELLLYDYIFDLNSVEGKKAYNDVLRSRKELRSFKALSPIKDINVQELHTSNIHYAEKISLEDQSKEKELRRVDRVFKGRDNFKIKKKRWKIGLDIIKTFEKKLSKSSHFISITQSDNKERYFHYTNISKVKEHDSRIKSLTKKYTENGYLLLKANKKGEILDNGFLQLGHSSEKKKEKFKRSNQYSLRKKLEFMLPPKIKSTIDWDAVKFNQKQKNARVYYQLIIKGEALNELQNINEEVLKKKLEQTYRSYRSIHRGFYLKENLKNKKFKSLIKKLKRLFTANSSGQTPKQKVKEFMKLEKSQFFKKIGRTLILSLLNPANLSNTVSFTLKWSSNKVKTKTFSFGNQKAEELYSNIEYLQSLIERREFDLRLVKFQGSLE
jgi:hypothetical protein